MNLLDKAKLTALLGTGLQDHGVTDDIMQSEAVSNVLGQMANMFNEAVTAATANQVGLQQKATNLQQEIAKGNKELSKLTKVNDAFLEATSDKLGPTPVPQQDMNMPEEPVPTPQEQPAPEMTPPEMNVPPAPDMGAVPDMSAQPTPDAGMMPPPDMTQISPDMLGAIQPRY